MHTCVRNVLILFVFFLFYASNLRSATLTNTVSYSRMQSRAATINSIDAVYYNPVGLVMLKDGLYLDFGEQIMTKTISHGIFLGNGEETTPSWCIPNFAFAYKKGRGALFLSLSMPEGVEFMKYTKPVLGIPLLAFTGLNLGPAQVGLLRQAGLMVSMGPWEVPNVTYVKTSSYWLQGKLGGAFSLNDFIAFTGGIASSYYKADESAGSRGAGTVYKAEMSAYGWSGFAGLMLSWPDKAVLTLLYATQVIARGTEHDPKINYSRIIEKRLSDYLLIGLNMISAEKASFQISYQVSFSGERSYGSKNILTSNHELGYLDWLVIASSSSGWAVTPLIANGNSQNYKYKNRHVIGFGLELEMNNLYPSIGFSYSTQEKYPRSQNSLDPDLSRFGIGAGLKIKVSDMISIETGSASYFFVTDRMFFKSIKMNKTAWIWGIGLTLKVM